MTFLGLMIPLLPLMGFLVNGLLGKYLPKGSTGWIGSLSVLASFICVLMIFKDGQIAARFVGVTTEAVLRAEMQRLVKS